MKVRELISHCWLPVGAHIRVVDHSLNPSGKCYVSKNRYDFEESEKKIVNGLTVNTSRYDGKNLVIHAENRKKEIEG